MTDQSIMGKKILAIFFLIFLCNCSPPCRVWEYDDNLTCDPCYNSGRLVLPADGTFCSLEISIMRDASGIRLYADTHVLYFPMDLDNPGCIQFELCIENVSSTSLFATRLRGGQRLQFDEAIKESIITALLEGHCVTMRIGQFHTTLIPEGFPQLWCKLLSFPVSTQ